MEYDKNKDYAAILDYLIKGGGSKEDVKQALEYRNQKIDEDQSLEKYRYDETAKEALEYINRPDLQMQKEESIKNYNNFIDMATDKSVNKLKDDIDSLDDTYNDQKSKIYQNARLSAIGNNERLAQQGLAKGLYDMPSSGYGEIARANLDANLQNNIIYSEKEKQSKINELNQKIRQALDDGEYKKAQNLVDTAYKYDFEINDQYNKDREYELDEREQENKEKQQEQENKYNERDFAAKQDQQKFENQIALEKLELDKKLNEGKISQMEYDNELSKLKAQAQKLENANILNDFKNSSVYKEIIGKVLSGNYTLSSIIESYMPVLKNYSSDALLEIADAYYKAQKNK